MSYQFPTSASGNGVGEVAVSAPESTAGRHADRGYHLKPRDLEKRPECGSDFFLRPQAISVSIYFNANPTTSLMSLMVLTIWEIPENVRKEIVKIRRDLEFN